MEISGLNVIITGGASGMGAATARWLSQQGAKIAIFDLQVTEASQVAEDCHGRAFNCDVTDADSVSAAITSATDWFGHIHACINCAGIVHSQRMVNAEGAMSLDTFRHTLEVNLVGTFNVMRLVAAAMQSAPLMPNTEERGVIINTASIAAYDGQIGQTAYSASKGGIVSMTLPAARELAQFAIRVMTIAPGLVDTPMFAQLRPEARAALAASVPFPKRLADPHEYARLVAHIIENPMLNGEVIRLDGALRMAPK